MVRDRFSPHNTFTLLVVLAGLTVLLAFFVPTHWRTWIHWSWLGIIGHFVGIAFVVFMVWGFAYECTAETDKGNKVSAYVVCVMAVLTAAVVLGLGAGMSRKAGDYIESGDYGGTEIVAQDMPAMSLAKRDALIRDIFLVALLPALFGVRCALGPKETK